ncbi:SpoIIIAH-like family protein [Bacillus songklensis]|uniref:SpoIIIAH-like family protein n=1 Tax=Bacillus songklensis TaxID=1069116 RepID=A0ABV8B0W9_9BACI
MLLKKQTVWLLTMLSLVVVLSVYYITSPEAPQENMALVEDEKKNDENIAVEEKQPVQEQTEQKEITKDADPKGKQEDSAQSEKNSAVISSVESDEMFTALRLEIEDERNKLREELQDIVASTDVSARQKSEAMDKMQELTDVAAKEAVIETLIKSKGYEDALVRADGGEVRITVKAKNHSRAQANEIIQLVRGELGSKQVAVEFEPVK